MRAEIDGGFSSILCKISFSSRPISPGDDIPISSRYHRKNSLEFERREVQNERNKRSFCISHGMALFFGFCYHFPFFTYRSTDAQWQSELEIAKLERRDQKGERIVLG